MSLKPLLLAVVALMTALMTGVPARAVTVPDLYEASVPVTTGRDAAFVEALRVVAVRVSGRADAGARLGAALDNPRQYAQRFGITADNVLQVVFDDASVDRLLTDAGLPVWGRERPATLILLDGSGGWVDATMASAEREAIARAARQRGLPIVWPDLTTQDRAQIGADTAGLLQMAARYNANAALLGTARAGGTVQWTLASADGVASAAGSLEEGVNLAADTFARVYSASGTTLDSVTVEVSGIGNLDAYATTLNYLEGLTLVRGVAVEQVLGDTLKFRLAVRGDVNTLRRALALDGRFVPAAQIDSGLANAAQPVDRLRLRYQP